jgi:exodeoxyribonuclease VII large subunit
LDALDRMRLTLGPNETLARGFAIVRSEGRVVTGVASAQAAGALEIEFADGRVAIGKAEAPKKPTKPIIGQGSLF